MERSASRAHANPLSGKHPVYTKFCQQHGHFTKRWAKSEGERIRRRSRIQNATMALGGPFPCKKRTIQSYYCYDLGLPLSRSVKPKSSGRYFDVQGPKRDRQGKAWLTHFWIKSLQRLGSFSTLTIVLARSKLLLCIKRRPCWRRYEFSMGVTISDKTRERTTPPPVYVLTAASGLLGPQHAQ